MAELSMKPVWTASFTSKELRLIEIALTGRAMTDEEGAQAVELGNRLSHLRAKTTLTTIQQATRLLNDTSGEDDGSTTRLG